MMTESTSVIAPPPERPDLKPILLSESDVLLNPPLDPFFLSTSDPFSMDAPISDFDFLQDNGSFADFDLSYDSDDFFDFTLDAEPAVVVQEENGNRSNLDSSETRNGDRSSEGRSNSVHSEVSSQGSKNFVSGACDPVDGLSSPDSTSSHQKSSISKRKKEMKDSGGEYRSCKYQKSDDNKSTATRNEEDDDDKKRVMRQIRNRESAQLSRLRKKQHIEDLEVKVKSMNATIAELNGKISYVMAENAALRQQMATASGVPAMNPYVAAPPLPYQWMPYPPYAFRGYGSQTPVVPIPKLNPKPVSACRPKKAESKKKEDKSKLKKVASISLIGVLFFFFLFGTLVQFMNVNYGGDSGSFGGVSRYEGQRYYDEHKAKVIMVGDGSDLRRESGNSDGNTHPRRKIHGERDSCGGVDYNAHPKVEGQANSLSNATEHLFASLYVPRNDRLEKIDGNLIIHSVLASEKAMAFKKNISETVTSEESDLKVPGVLSSALAVPKVRGNAAMLPHSMALSSERKRLDQWFHEGGSGALMDYSMCTEVFRFDIAPGAIVPSSVSNISEEHLQNVTTHGKRMKNRRILERLPVSFAQPSKDAQNKSFHGNTKNKPTSSSSMVVSVLLDARGIGDSESDIVVPPKPNSLSRILVVVLLDSVKYVTYSCALPRSGLDLVAT